MKPICAAAALAFLVAGPSFSQQGNPGQHFLEQWDADGDGAVTTADFAR
ncbi:MAG: hypothetical protein ACK4TJ_07380 [Tabrizicola sp.]